MQSDVGMGVSVDNGSPTASYITRLPIDVNDMAEQNNDDADDGVVDKFDNFDDTDMI